MSQAGAALGVAVPPASRRRTAAFLAVPPGPPSRPSAEVVAEVVAEEMVSLTLSE
jgi:hypothetical protein